ncbi:MAG: iron-sulfur cluster assembly scaffold protein [Desulfobacterales bacterium]|nr:iron-sulfur cluster assembly scaffold protein [Desulfobacterales bacterium]
MNTGPPDLWQTHAIRFLECAFRSDRHERLQQADGRGQKTRECGDSVEIFVILKAETIQNIAYTLNGCIHTNACVNALIDLAEGQSLNKALQITPQQVAAYLQSLSPKEFHCAELAVETFRLALADARRTRQAPWKKNYR